MSNDDGNLADHRTRAAITGLAMAAALATPVACTGKQAAPSEQPTPVQPPIDEPQDSTGSDDAGADTGSTSEGEDADAGSDDDAIGEDDTGDWSNQGGTRG